MGEQPQVSWWRLISRVRRALNKKTGRDAVALRDELGARRDDQKARTAHLQHRIAALQERAREAEDQPGLWREDDLGRCLNEIRVETKRLWEAVESLDKEDKGLTARVKAGTAWMDRINARIAPVGLVLQLLIVASAVMFPGSARAANGVHLEYYSAITVIAPVLFVAGFVELVNLFRRSLGVWAILSFAVPGVTAGGAALYVLATHKSTPVAFTLTQAGLLITLAFLIIYFAGHAWGPQER